MKIAAANIKISKLAIALASCCITFAFIDLFLYKFFNRTSVDFSVQLINTFGEKNCQYFSSFFSVGFTAILAFLFIIELLLEPSKLKLSYEFVLLLTSSSVLTLIKSVYARGRPYIYSDQIRIEECACDHGMPSGHAGNIYILIYLAEGWLVRFLRKGPKRNFIDYILRVLRVVSVLCIGLGRILAGLHSYNQVFLGYLIACFFCELLTFENYKQIFQYWIRPKIFATKCFIISLVVTAFAHIIYLVNTSWRSQHDDWKFWNKCPECKGSFDEGDLAQNAVPVLYWLFLISINIHVNTFKGIRNKINSEKKLTVKNWLVRLLVYAVVSLPIPGVLFLISSKVLTELKSRELRASLRFFANVLAGAYLSLAVLFLVPQCFRKLEVEIRPDFIEKFILDKSLENDGPYGEKENNEE